MRLEGRVAVVTGGARGIGAAIVRRLAREGADVMIGDVLQAEGEAVATSLAELGRRGVFRRTDVSRPAEAAALVDAAVATLGRIDILVNDAGICPLVPIDEVDEATFDAVVGVNLKGTFFASQAAYRHMKAQRSGRIINIASPSAYTGGAMAVGGTVAVAPYAATKAGVVALTKSFSTSLAPYNVTVNAVTPGLVLSDMTRDWPEDRMNEILKTIPLGRLAHPDDIAAAVAYLASDDAAYVTGAVIDVTGGAWKR